MWPNVCLVVSFIFAVLAFVFLKMHEKVTQEKDSLVEQYENQRKEDLLTIKHSDSLVSVLNIRIKELEGKKDSLISRIGKDVSRARSLTEVKVYKQDITEALKWVDSVSVSH